MVRRAWSGRRARGRAAGSGSTSGTVGALDEGAVRERGDDAGEELRAEVDGQLLPLDGAAGDLLDEHRAEGAGRVDRGAGGRRDGDDRGEDDEADRDPGEPGRGLVVDDAEDGEHEDEGSDELGREGLADTHRIGVRRDAEADVAGLLPEHGDDRGGADDRRPRTGRAM